MTNESMIASNNITLTHGKNVITDEYEISQTFNICRSVGNQLNALIRLKSYLSFNAKRVLIDSYII